ncbi:MAG: carboxypeptidase-like regulatory domain-containing protein, partial [Gemmatimonadetes bacterium]|nr:carboxypeptidase-like regulatory domain-containing protein [Gemmatimonadota bacterium]
MRVDERPEAATPPALHRAAGDGSRRLPPFVVPSSGGIMQRNNCSGWVLFAAFLLIVPRVGAQQVTGRITDQRSGQAMAAVQVSINGTGIGALTQNTGRYLLLNVPLGTHTVTAQRIGYRTVSAQVTVTAGATVVQDFALTEEALGLDEIIVTGTPGGTQRRAIGNAVTSVSA